MRLLYVYKYNPQDPTERALRKWLAKSDATFFEFRFEESERNRKTSFRDPPLSRLLRFVEANEPTHVFCWVPYLIPSEVAWLRKRNVFVASAVNGVTSFTHGFCKDQGEYLESLRAQHLYLVPHAPHVSLLREAGINAVEFPFCYDEDAFRPLSSAGILRTIAPFHGSFIGNFGPVEIAQGHYRAKALKALADKVRMLAVTDSTYRNYPLGKGVLRAPTIANLATLNCILNASAFTLGADAFPEIDKYYQAAQTNVRIPYDPVRDAFVMRPRTFWSMGSGTPFLVDAYPELLRYFTAGEHLLTWASPEEAAAIIVPLLGEPDKLREIGERGRMRVQALHSARVRARQLLEILSNGRAPDFTSGKNL